MANLVDLGCKCGARGGDPSENSHYMIIHHFASPIANVQLWIVLLYWAKAWCLYSGRKLPKYILSSKRENFSKRFKWNCTNCRIMSTVQHCCRAWLSGGQIMQKMIILALCYAGHYAARLRNSAQPDASRLHEPIYISHRFKPQSFHLHSIGIILATPGKAKHLQNWQNWDSILQILFLHSIGTTQKNKATHTLIPNSMLS